MTLDGDEFECYDVTTPATVTFDLKALKVFFYLYPVERYLLKSASGL